MLGSFGLCSLQGIISLAQPILQHLNVGPWHGTIIVGHYYSLSEALDNGFPLLGRQRRKPKSAALLLVLRKQPFNLALNYLPSLTTLPPKLLGEKRFQVALRLGLLLGSSRELALCRRSVHAAPLPTPGHRLAFGLELLEQPTATLDHGRDRARFPFSGPWPR